MDILKQLMEISIQCQFLIIKTKKKFKKYEEQWNKIRDLIRPITKNLDDYDEKYIKIKLASDDELPYDE